jgi:hypothetical protein
MCPADDAKENALMRRLPLLQLLIVLSFLGDFLGASTAWPQPKGSIGKVTALEGKATVLRQGRFAPEPLATQEAIFQEDIIQTDAASKVKITLIDATVISLGEQSRLELKEFAYSSPQQTLTARFSIAVGIFRAIVNKLIPQSAFEVTTPTAVAAIRGTDFMGEVKPDSTAIVVLEGTVVISNVRLTFRGIATLLEGTGTTVADDQPPSAPTKWSESRIEALRRATALR